MESLKFKRLLVNPTSTFLYRQGVVQLSVEGQHVQLHRLAIHFFHSVHHVLNKLGVTCTRRVDTYSNLRLLRLLLVGAFRFHLLTVGINGILTYPVCSQDWRS